MKHRVLFLSLACAAALAACQTSATVPSFAANVARSDRAGTTQAWGYVYSDPEGKPLANVRVEIAAWAPVHGKLQPSHQVARTNTAGRFAFTAPNGKYLLTIGSDEAYTPPPGLSNPRPAHLSRRRSRPPQHALARNRTRHDRPKRRPPASQSIRTSKTSLCRQSRRPIQIRASAGNRANKKLSHHPTLKNRSRMPRRRTDPPSSTPPNPLSPTNG